MPSWLTRRALAFTAAALFGMAAGFGSMALFQHATIAVLAGLVVCGLVLIVDRISP
jgi:hypothetical protein